MANKTWQTMNGSDSGNGSSTGNWDGTLPTRREIAFIDPAVSDVHVLVAGMRPGVEPILLNATEPTSRQMARALAGRDGLEAIHVIAHGAPGRVNFAAGEWAPETLADDSADFAEIGQALGEHGGLRLWSCFAGAGAEGETLVARLMAATGVNVAAAHGLIGSEALGGRWKLDGLTETAPPLTFAAAATYIGVMATKTWVGGTGSNKTTWSRSQNWTNGIPVAGDDIVINSVTSGGYPVLDVSNVAYDSLTIGAGASLAVSTFALTVTGTGTGATDLVSIAAGGTLTMTTGGSVTAGGVTVSGTLSGAGLVHVSNVGTTTHTINGAGTITASGGTLEVNGIITGTLALTVGSTGTDKLLLDAASAASSLTFGTAGTLELNTAGTLTLTSALAIGANTVKLDAAGGTAQLTDSAGVTLAGGTISGTGSLAGTTSLSGYGTVSAPVLSGAGTITASGGTLNLAGNIGASSGHTFDIANTATSVLKLSGTVGGTNTFTFVGTLGALELADVTIGTGGLHFAGSVAGLHVNTGAGSASPNLGTTNYINVQTTNITNVVLTNSTHIELYSGTTDLGTITLATATTAAYVDWFADAGHAGGVIGSGIDIILSDTVCFATGTRILTTTGEKTVESLLQGDMVVTVLGGGLSAQPVKWLGRRRIDLTAHPRPGTVAPIRVQRGAFADNMPHTDLIVSPDHAIFVDGKLIAARQLVNGTTIRQEKNWTLVEYFHVELETHAVLLAEGLPAESYLDTGNRGFFANSGEPLVLHPDLTDEADCPTREATSCAPFVWDEDHVRPVWQHLADRAAALGQPAPVLETSNDAGLHIVAKGRAVRPLHGENGLFIFVLPKGATKVRVVSRAGSPADTRPWLDDRRCLGVSVERIVLRDRTGVKEIPVDHPELSQGWWAVEKVGSAPRRWTNGNATLELPATDGPTMLEVHASNGGMVYVADTDQNIRAA